MAATETTPAHYTLRLSNSALADIENILEWTVGAFGVIGCQRYEALIETALVHLSTDPSRPGVKQRKDLGKEIYTYHLSSSRLKPQRTATQVAKPRHFIVFSITGQTINVARLLHDAMDLAQHLPVSR
jgi:toxin ParE1/3/4